MKRIRGGSGLGDSIYLRPICEHFVRGGEPVTVMSNFAGVFDGSGVTVEPFRRDRVDMVAHYVGGKHNPATTLWQDLCAHAGVSVPLQIEWRLQNRRLVDGLAEKASGRPSVIVHGGREPMGRRDKFGIELLPAPEAFDAALDALHDCFLVRIGKGDEIYSLRADLDLSNRTSVADVMDIAAVSSGIVAQCSFAVPLAEALDKPLLAIWSARGLASNSAFIKTVTPSKILSKPGSHYVMDDEPAGKIEEAARAFRGVG